MTFKEECWTPIQISAACTQYHQDCYVLFETDKGIPKEDLEPDCCGNCEEFFGVEGSSRGQCQNLDAHPGGFCTVRRCDESCGYHRRKRK